MAVAVEGQNKPLKNTAPWAEWFGVVTADTDYDGGSNAGYLITPAMVGMNKVTWAQIGNGPGYQAQIDYASWDEDAGFKVRFWKGVTEASDAEDQLENLEFPLHVIGS